MSQKVIAKLERKSKLALGCPFCGQTPKFEFSIEKHGNKWGHYAIRNRCCNVTQSGQTELFFSDDRNVGLFKSMGHRIMREWSQRV